MERNIHVTERGVLPNQLGHTGWASETTLLKFAYRLDFRRRVKTEVFIKGATEGNTSNASLKLEKAVQRGGHRGRQGAGPGKGRAQPGGNEQAREGLPRPGGREDWGEEGELWLPGWLEA